MSMWSVRPCTSVFVNKPDTDTRKTARAILSLDALLQCNTLGGRIGAYNGQPTAARV